MRAICIIRNLRTNIYFFLNQKKGSFAFQALIRVKVLVLVTVFDFSFSTLPRVFWKIISRLTFLAKYQILFLFLKVILAIRNISQNALVPDESMHFCTFSTVKLIFYLFSQYAIRVQKNALFFSYNLRESFMTLFAEILVLRFWIDNAVFYEIGILEIVFNSIWHEII